MQVTIRFGTEDFHRTYPEGTTVGSILQDNNLKIIAGWGDNVRAMVAGVEQPTTAIAPDGGVLTVETRANDKAS